jgi:hypothetical protein
MSGRSDLMLKHSLQVLASQRKYVWGNEQGQEAYNAGVAHWREYYGARLMKTVRLNARARQWGRALRGALVLLRYYPRGVANKASRRLVEVTTRAPRFFSRRVLR